MKNIDVTIRICPSGTKWMSAKTHPVGVRYSQDLAETIYLNGQSSIPITGHQVYPGYLEWLVNQIGNGETENLDVTTFMNKEVA